MRKVALVCGLAAAILALARPVGAQVYGGVYVQTAPPAAIYETIPAAPGRPYSGAVWHPGHWVQSPNGWYWRPGHWGRP
ncbi:MAG: YXWGXW repeat-containing protein [Candidatus Eremiobacteraeota bacterium]|nr:YXWGXW repeat-containing protein [Candidatus Eremiobacteraeota bacterium]